MLYLSGLRNSLRGLLAQSTANYASTMTPGGLHKESWWILGKVTGVAMLTSLQVDSTWSPGVLLGYMWVSVMTSNYVNVCLTINDHVEQLKFTVANIREQDLRTPQGQRSHLCPGHRGLYPNHYKGPPLNN